MLPSLVRVKNDLILTTVLPNRKPADLQNLAPGTHPPFITFNNEVKTDVNKIEEFLEEVLCPPQVSIQENMPGNIAVFLKLCFVWPLETFLLIVLKLNCP